ncbi:MAG: hypothetical protein JXR97_15460 [Planctomycetes bacterium]|nr:hypothetical protein [Planctomycetota bacterium]
MQTDWDLIRKVMNTAIDACAELDSLEISLDEKCNPEIRWGDFETGVAVGDFLQRFHKYPEGSQRDIIRLRSRLGFDDQKYRSELALALINTAAACAEIIGLSEDELDREDESFTPHCDSAENSIRIQLENIGVIYKGWMVPEVKTALKAHREKTKGAE